MPQNLGHGPVQLLRSPFPCHLEPAELQGLCVIKVRVIAPRLHGRAADMLVRISTVSVGTALVKFVVLSKIRRTPEGTRAK